MVYQSLCVPLEIFTELAYRLFNNLGSPFFIFSVEMLANAAVYRAAAFSFAQSQMQR